jgi:hypothetical protein
MKSTAIDLGTGSAVPKEPGSRLNLWNDLILPTLLFAALGGMTWAVRGCSGFGAVAGCIFAGVMWGAAWWYLARNPMGEPSRRYASGWIVLAMTVGIGYAGSRGWMQWPSFWEGHLQTNTAKGEFLPISRFYGFLWLFIAGVPWAGLGACMLAWCGSRRETRVWHWVLRIACGIGGGLLAGYLYRTFPQYFLPMYDTYVDHYKDFAASPNLRRLYNDCNAAVTHMGYYLGFLAFELIRREWKNAVLILTVGLINGAGWALCQNWSWARKVWPDGKFNFWRCWESSGGLSIGIAYGIAYFLVNRPMSDREKAEVMARRSLQGPNFEWLLVYTSLAYLVNMLVGFQMGGGRSTAGLQSLFSGSQPADVARRVSWAPWYFTVALTFGLLYYLWNRRKPTGNAVAAIEPAHDVAGVAVADSPSVPAPAGVGTALVAVLVVGATIAGLFPEITQYILPRGRVQGGGGRWQYLMYYEAAVMAIGLAWYWLKRPACDAEKDFTTPVEGDSNIERFGLYAGIFMGLGLSITNGAKGWFNIYRTDIPEGEWFRIIWSYLGPVYLGILILIALWILIWPQSRIFRGRRFPHAYGLMWLVLIVQNAIAFAITGPYSNWPEAAFAIYYLLLFFITAVIVTHDSALKTWRAAD